MRLFKSACDVCSYSWRHDSPMLQVCMCGGTGGSCCDAGPAVRHIVWAGGRQTSSACVHPSAPESAQQSGTSADVRPGCRMTNTQTHTYPDDTHSHGVVKSCKLPSEEALCISAGSRVTKDTRARSLLPSYTLTGTPTWAPKKSSCSHLALPLWNPFSPHRATAYTLPVRPARVSQHICQRGPFQSSYNGVPTDEADPFWVETDIKSRSDCTQRKCLRLWRRLVSSCFLIY